jgi:hypothetical protein
MYIKILKLFCCASGVKGTFFTIKECLVGYSLRKFCFLVLIDAGGVRHTVLFFL